MTTDEERHGLHRRLVGRLGERVGEALYTFVACLLALGVSGLAALNFNQSLLFPSLGPKALLFFEPPTAPTAMAALMAGVVLLSAVGWLINRASGMPAPVWGATG